MNLNVTDYLIGSYMAKLGGFIFKCSSLSFTKLTRRTKYVWKRQNLIGGYPALLGGQEGLEKITIQGEIFPGFHRLAKNNSLNTLRNMAKEKEAYTLTFTDSFRTKNEGKYVISSIKEDCSIFNAKGTPLKTSFLLELIKHED